MNLAHDAIKLGALDVSDLKAAVAAFHDTDWTADKSRQAAFDAHASTQTLKLIADGDFRHVNPTRHALFFELEPLLAPLIAHIRARYSQTLRQKQIAAQYGDGYIVRALLTRLPPGAEIRPHIDEGESLKRCHRVHVPLLTNPASYFMVGRLKFHMPEGEIWEINNRRLHAVRNEGDTPRIHLILDYVQPGEKVFDLQGILTA
jgi:hypothetical protein